MSENHEDTPKPKPSDGRDPRDMIFVLIKQYRDDARERVAKLIAVPFNYINNWIDGVFPEPVNRKRIADAYDGFVATGAPVAIRDFDTGALPHTGELVGAEILTLDQIIDKPPGNTIWGIAVRRFNEQVFVNRGHVEFLRKAGAGVGTRFYALVGPKTKEGSGFEFEIKGLDVII